MTHSGAHPSDRLGNRHIRDTSHIVSEEDDFGIYSGTDTSKIFDIYSSRRITL